ncbi:molecular chaperone [Escherichia coli]|uniref:fimbrial biogenesis chaperone n=1 Tax=Escherichia coli TaxID=562 RepID=UPI001F05F989|nr:molecular chaperone [Escherichia coli]MCH0581424.1 molecular chaperone [Escherichia coli]
MKLITLISCIYSLIFPSLVLADGLSLGGTRLIYDATKKEASITLENSGKSAPQLVQAWVSDKNRKVADIPFVVTPPVSKLAQNATTTVRVVYTGRSTSLPTDRESQFLLNVRTVPATEKQDNPQRLTIATQNIIKLIYRPAGLSSSGASRAGESLKVTRAGNEVRFENPTPYVVSLTGVTINGVKVEQPGTVQPRESLSLPSPAGLPASVVWNTINDFGGLTKESRLNF